MEVDEGEWRQMEVDEGELGLMEVDDGGWRLMEVDAWRTFFSLPTKDLGVHWIDSIWKKNTQKLLLQISCTMILGPHKLKNLQTQTYFWPKKLGGEQERGMEIVCTSVCVRSLAGF